MSCASTDMHSSPAIMKKSRCRSTGANSKISSSVIPGTRCLVYLRRCLAIQLQKVGLFPNNSGAASSSNTVNDENTLDCDERSVYWMYDSGYLIFQGFLEANLKCFWNDALMEAMKVLAFQGYIAPGVLLVSGTPCALEVVRAAWARNVLKPPNNYVITVVGDTDDCLVEPISQGQFTPLPEALCWIILDMTASGQAAVMESICLTLHVAFPDMQRPSEQLVYDTLAKLMAEKKVYQTSKGYFVMTPNKMRLSGLTNGKSDYRETYSSGHRHKQILLTPDEAAVMIHGEIETVRDGNVTHQAIQTNLADVICGGNSSDKVLYPRVTSCIKSGYSSERLQRRHSMRLFGQGSRSHSVQRTSSIKNVPDKGEKVQIARGLSSFEDSRKRLSLFSRLFRRSDRMRKDISPSPIIRPTFSAQFPPAEWFNRGVTLLHSVGTQTSSPNTDTLPERTFDYNFDDESLQEAQRRHISTFGTPRMIRRISHSATLPRRSLKKSQLYSISPDKDTIISRISSQNSVAANSPSSNEICITPRTGSHSSVASSKTIISKEHGTNKKSQPSAHKSMSSASFGYNSLPRSVYSGDVRPGKNSSSSSRSNVKGKPNTTRERTFESSSITFHVSAKSSTDFEANRSNSSPTNETNATTMTTTINSGNETKIFLQQHNTHTPTRSLITFEKSLDKNEKPDIVINNQPYTYKNKAKENKKSTRPTSLYGEQYNLIKSNKQCAKLLETQLKAKFPSTETIQLVEKSVEVGGTENNNKKLVNLTVLDNMVAKNTNLLAFNSETELNNAKNYALNQNSNTDKTINFINKNVLANSKGNAKFHTSSETEQNFSKINNNIKKYNDWKIENELEGLNLGDNLKGYPDFPSLSDLSLRFTSLAAQSILKGVSYNSMDTLVEVNMAAEKKTNCEMTISTDLGIV